MAPAASPSTAPAAGLLSAQEAAIARRLLADWGRPPSDRPDAVLLCDRANIKCWRRKATQPGGFDEYESQLWLPVQPTTLLAMLCDVNERVAWDKSTLQIDVLATRGPAPLRALHEQDGDDMTLLWLQETPWPLSNREYVLNRRVCVLRPPGAEGAAVYAKADVCLDAPAARALRPTPLPKAKRVPEHVNIQAVWADPSPGGGTCYRCFYREDPMMTLPKWLLSWLMDKMMPTSLNAMVHSAVVYEKRKQHRRHAYHNHSVVYRTSAKKNI